MAEGPETYIDRQARLVRHFFNGLLNIAKPSGSAIARNRWCRLCPEQRADVSGLGTLIHAPALVEIRS